MVRNTMATITGFVCVDENGRKIPCDAFGNNVAFSCVECGHPMLAIIREHQRGSDAANPAVCPVCGFRAWFSVDHVNELIKLQCLTSV
jgi:predicted RNA-binding Zn-ribbon protein involved in translation (DUF1610 family)